MSPRVLVLGIDAASPELLDRWVADGMLPNIGALAARGLVADTRGVDGFFIGATWPSLSTGLSPARHGVHYSVQVRPGTYAFHPVVAEPLVKCEPFWSVLSRAGKRVAVLDVPLSRPDPHMTGVQVVEWGGHDAVFGLQTVPAALAGELRARFGAHPLGASCDADRRTASDYESLIAQLLAGIERKAEWTADLLGRGPWDLFMQVFTEAHCAGHQCWHLHDATHPAHDAELVARNGDPLRRAYAALDAAIGRLVDGAPDSRVVLLSAHGMARWHGAQFLLPEILSRLGVTSARPAPLSRGPLAAASAAARSVWRTLPGSARRALRPLRDRVLGEASAAPVLPRLDVDASRSLCFVVPNGFPVGAIRLNLAGREPDGAVRPGADADALCERLRGSLLDIVDERTGGPLIRAVRRTRDLYEGEHLDHLPDLLVEWSDDTATGSVLVGDGVGARVRARSNEIGVIEGVNHYGRTGEHRPGGRLVVAGPGVPAGRLDRDVSILDVAPTIAALLGVELGPVDGQAVAEIAS